jgi:DNA mismatch endonuclease, patch repair protein
MSNLKHASSDTFSKKDRSKIMRAIKGVGTKPEHAFYVLLAQLPISVRAQAKELPGSPDFVCDELKMAFFVDGDFWHGREWYETGQAPIGNRSYWIDKFERNRARDLISTRRLRRSGWSVVRVWESDLQGNIGLVQRLLNLRIRRRSRELNPASVAQICAEIAAKISRESLQESTIRPVVARRRKGRI